MSYSFWCTPCGKDHAGECPPARPVKGSAGKLIINGKEIEPMDPGSFYSPPPMPLKYPAPAPGMTSSGTPIIGSKWRSEIRNSSTDPWRVGNSMCVYEVTGVNGNTVDVKVLNSNTLSPTGSNFKYPLEFWDDDGHTDKYGSIVRFVYVP